MRYKLYEADKSSWIRRDQMTNELLYARLDR